MTMPGAVVKHIKSVPEKKPRPRRKLCVNSENIDPVFKQAQELWDKAVRSSGQIKDVKNFSEYLKNNGPYLENNYKDWLDKGFAKIRDLARDEDIGPLHRTLLTQLLETRAQDWSMTKSTADYYHAKIPVATRLQPVEGQAVEDCDFDNTANSEPPVEKCSKGTNLSEATNLHQPRDTDKDGPNQRKFKLKRDAWKGIVNDSSAVETVFEQDSKDTCSSEDTKLAQDKDSKKDGRNECQFKLNRDAWKGIDNGTHTVLNKLELKSAIVRPYNTGSTQGIVKTPKTIISPIRWPRSTPPKDDNKTNTHSGLATRKGSGDSTNKPFSLKVTVNNDQRTVTADSDDEALVVPDSPSYFLRVLTRMSRDPLDSDDSERRRGRSLDGSSQDSDGCCSPLSDIHPLAGKQEYTRGPRTAPATPLQPRHIQAFEEGFDTDDDTYSVNLNMDTKKPLPHKDLSFSPQKLGKESLTNDLFREIINNKPQWDCYSEHDVRINDDEVTLRPPASVRSHKTDGRTVLETLEKVSRMRCDYEEQYSPQYNVTDKGDKSLVTFLEFNAKVLKEPKVVGMIGLATDTYIKLMQNKGLDNAGLVTFQVQGDKKKRGQAIALMMARAGENSPCTYEQTYDAEKTKAAKRPLVTTSGTSEKLRLTCDNTQEKSVSSLPVGPLSSDFHEIRSRRKSTYDPTTSSAIREIFSCTRIRHNRESLNSECDLNIPAHLAKDINETIWNKLERKTETHIINDKGTPLLHLIIQGPSKANIEHCLEILEDLIVPTTDDIKETDQAGGDNRSRLCYRELAKLHDRPNLLISDVDELEVPRYTDAPTASALSKSPARGSSLLSRLASSTRSTAVAAFRNRSISHESPLERDNKATGTKNVNASNSNQEEVQDWDIAKEYHLARSKSVDASAAAGTSEFQRSSVLQTADRKYAPGSSNDLASARKSATPATDMYSPPLRTLEETPENTRVIQPLSGDEESARPNNLFPKFPSSPTSVRDIPLPADSPQTLQGSINARRFSTLSSESEDLSPGLPPQPDSLLITRSRLSARHSLRSGSQRSRPSCPAISDNPAKENLADEVLLDLQLKMENLQLMAEREQTKTDTSPFGKYGIMAAAISRGPSKSEGDEPLETIARQSVRRSWPSVSECLSAESKEEKERIPRQPRLIQPTDGSSWRCPLVEYTDDSSSVSSSTTNNSIAGISVPILRHPIHPDMSLNNIRDSERTMSSAGMLGARNRRLLFRNTHLDRLRCLHNERSNVPPRVPRQYQYSVDTLLKLASAPASTRSPADFEEFWPLLMQKFPNVCLSQPWGFEPKNHRVVDMTKPRGRSNDPGRSRSDGEYVPPYARSRSSTREGFGRPQSEDIEFRRSRSRSPSRDSFGRLRSRSSSREAFGCTQSGDANDDSVFTRPKLDSACGNSFRSRSGSCSGNVYSRQRSEGSTTDSVFASAKTSGVIFNRQISEGSTSDSVFGRSRSDSSGESSAQNSGMIFSRQSVFGRSRSDSLSESSAQSCGVIINRQMSEGSGRRRSDSIGACVFGKPQTACAGNALRMPSSQGPQIMLSSQGSLRMPSSQGPLIMPSSQGPPRRPSSQEPLKMSSSQGPNECRLRSDSIGSEGRRPESPSWSDIAKKLTNDINIVRPRSGSLGRTLIRTENSDGRRSDSTSWRTVATRSRSATRAEYRPPNSSNALYVGSKQTGQTSRSPSIIKK